MLKRLFASRKHPFVPGIDKPEHIEFDLSGNQLSLTLPPHSDYEGFEADQAPITKVNIFDPSIYQEPERMFTSTLLVKRNWEFYGPFWQTRPVGTIRFAAVVEKPNCLPNDMSCLNQNHFEQVINRFMFKVGPETPQAGEQLAPINWQVSSVNGATLVLFEMHKDLNKINNPAPFRAAQFSSYIFTPLDDKHYLRLMFHNFGYAPTKYSIEKMNSVRNRICGNLSLILNNDAQAKINSNSQNPTGSAISKHRMPEKWLYPEWRGGNSSEGEPHVVILKPGSHPPKFLP